MVLKKVASRLTNSDDTQVPLYTLTIGGNTGKCFLKLIKNLIINLKIFQKIRKCKSLNERQKNKYKKIIQKYCIQSRRLKILSSECPDLSRI